MAIRLRLLQGATALLYMGPLIAGLAGFGWAMLLPFVSVFVLWLMLLRPHQWPQSNREWLQASAWIAALTQILTQVLLVAVLFGIGRGIGGVMGQVPLVFPMLPLALSFIAIPLARLVWNSDKALAKGLSIDELLYPHKQPQPTLHPAPTPEVVVEPLFAFPDNAPLADLGPALEEALEDAGAWAVLAVVADRLDAAPGRHACLREALLIWATDPGNFASNAAPAGMRAAFQGSRVRPAVAADPAAARRGAGPYHAGTSRAISRSGRSGDLGPAGPARPTGHRPRCTDGGLGMSRRLSTAAPRHGCGPCRSAGDLRLLEATMVSADKPDP